MIKRWGSRWRCAVRGVHRNYRTMNSYAAISAAVRTYEGFRILLNIMRLVLLLLIHESCVRSFCFCPHQLSVVDDYRSVPVFCLWIEWANRFVFTALPRVEIVNDNLRHSWARKQFPYSLWFRLAVIPTVYPLVGGHLAPPIIEFFNQYLGVHYAFSTKPPLLQNTILISDLYSFACFIRFHDAIFWYFYYPGDR